MKRLNTLLLLALVGLLCFTLGMLQDRPVASAASDQQWEYAQVYSQYKDEKNTFISSVAIIEEKKEIDAGLSQFNDPDSASRGDILAPAKVLNYMGELGWELISYTEHFPSSGAIITTYTFKRPL